MRLSVQGRNGIFPSIALRIVCVKGFQVINRSGPAEISPPERISTVLSGVFVYLRGEKRV